MFFNRYAGGENALLLHIEGLDYDDSENSQEFHELAKTSGVKIKCSSNVNIRTINPKYFISTGKVEEIKQEVDLFKIELILFNHSLSPSQERNLEHVFKCRVVDRTGLILDIFAQRAQTHEGKLQVELAQLDHISTRLVRGWTHLERQKGGVGLRGPGETQLETDRRLIRERIRSINKKLDKVKKQRYQTRRSRTRAEIPQISIVGYTNAGKSTLFNNLTSSGVYVKDQLFATLDPTLRKLDIDNIGPVIVADTVGFIRHLPHKLIEAFQTTLEETVLADLLLHVVDCSAIERDDNIQQVEHVLSEIDASERPQLIVYNKIDAAKKDARIDRDQNGKPCSVWISALNGVGIDLLLQAVSERLSSDLVTKKNCFKIL